jgi:cytosine deaminase
MDLTIHHARVEGRGQLVDVGIAGGQIVDIQEAGLAPGAQAINAAGALLSPAFVDPHFHLENALLHDVVNTSGTLREAIKIYAGIKREMSPQSMMDRASRALRQAMANGTLYLRSHVDVDQVGKLRLLDGVRPVREKFAGIVDVQLVAFPQLGLVRNPEAVDLMWQAMEQGAQVVGGMPHGERDMDDAARHIDIAFEIAKKYDADVDMHVDETDDPYWRSLELLADKAIEEGYQGRVSAGHCCAMAGWDDAVAERVIEKVCRAGITIITNTPVNLVIQGHGSERPVRRGIARVRELIDAGANVACGQDDMRNMFYPFGQMDMLEVANFVAHTAHLSSPAQIQAAFDMPRYNAARALRLPGYGVHVGAVANLVLVEADSAAEALSRQPARPYVIREGQVLVHSVSKTEYASQVPA